MPDRTCPECDEKKSCGGHHVYVIELDKEKVLSMRGSNYFKDNIDKLQEGKSFFYVGETKHHVMCRFRLHRTKKRTRKENTHFECFCKTGAAKNVPYSPFNRGNKYVKRAKKRIREDIFFKHNPIRRTSKKEQTDAGKELEAELTRELERQGHLAYSK